MSTQVSTQNRTAEGTAKKTNTGKPRGGSNNRGSNRARAPGGDGKGKVAANAKAAAVTTGPNTTVTEESMTPDAGETKIVEQLSTVALSEAGDADVCWICAESVKYFAVSECNHRTCHVCALRLRALYKKLECTFCKDPQKHIIFTVSPDKPFGSYTPEDVPHKDAKLSISFETQEMMEETLILLRFNCPDSECDYIGNGWGDLRLHVRATHGKLMCDLCIRHKKVFSHEHAIYPPGLLPVHLPSMSQRPSKAAMKETPVGGVHPYCAFCRECYFGDDELYAHMREKHEECFICKRNEVRDQYFQNYESLEHHFNTQHYPCTQSECLNHKFVVFNTPLDLKAHMVETHGGDMSARDKKEARRIQAEFTFEEVGQGGRHGRGGGGGGGGGGRERDRDRDRERDREPPPHTRQQQQQQPQASTSTVAAVPAPSGGGRRAAFGGALTDANTPAAPTTNNNGRGTRPSSPHPATDIDPAVAERHAAFLARLQSLAPNPTTAVPAVKAATRGYRFSESSARDLILTVWNVLDRNLEHTASIVNAFIDLLDEEEKKQDLLSSWKGFAIEQRRQFPDLTPTSFGSGYAGITSGRVLNAKHSTATRSSQSQQVWNRVEQAASSSSAPSAPASYLPPIQPVQDRFPALGGTSTSGTLQASASSGRAGQRSTPWSGSSIAPSSLRTQASIVSSSPSAHSLARKTGGNSGAKQRPPPKLSGSLFPELPTSSSARSKPQVRGNVSLKNILGSTGAPAVAAWGSGPAIPDSGSGDAEESANPDTETPAQGGKGKKSKGKQKQTLFTLGTFPT